MTTSVIILLFLGAAYSYGQEKSTVLIEASINGDSYRIHTVKPDYTYEIVSNKEVREQGRVALKKELDKWVLDGYVLVNSTVNTFPGGTNSIIYYLLKE